MDTQFFIFDQVYDMDHMSYLTQIVATVTSINIYICTHHHAMFYFYHDMNCTCIAKRLSGINIEIHVFARRKTQLIKKRYHFHSNAYRFLPLKYNVIGCCLLSVYHSHSESISSLALHLTLIMFLQIVFQAGDDDSIRKLDLISNFTWIHKCPLWKCISLFILNILVCSLYLVIDHFVI